MKLKISKKEVILNIVMTVIVFVLGVLLATCLPEKESTLVRKNQGGGSNQQAIRQLPAVHSFEDYLRHIEQKDTEYMWENSSSFRKTVFGDMSSMRYDYCLTRKYEVLYIIPIGEGSRLKSSRLLSKEDSLKLNKDDEELFSPKSPISERTFSFYALIRFEDDVCVEGEVDRLKDFHNVELEKICDMSCFEPEFEQVLEEVYEFVDRRFVVDSVEYVRNELNDYLMKMTMKDYALLDWRFPVLFAKQLQLPIKQMDRSDKALYEMLGHSLFSQVVMVEEDGVWKLGRFKTIASSRW